MRWNIYAQLLVPLLAVLLGLFGLGAWTAVTSAQRGLRGQIEMQVRQVARTLSDARFPLTPTVLEQMKGLSGADYLLIDGEGDRTTTFARNRVPLPPVVAVLDWRELRLGPAVQVGDESFLCAGVQLRQPWSQQTATLYVFYPQQQWQEAFWQAIRPSLWLSLAGSVVGLGLVVVVAHRFVSRIRRLQTHLRAIAEGNFQAAVPTGNDEFADLTRSANEMAEQLSQLHDSLQRSERLRLLGQVSGGLAHQMRNGLTGARLAVQLHTRQCKDTGSDVEDLEVAIRQLTILEEKLQRFLDLGSSGSGRRQKVSLLRLVDEALALVRPQCRHAGIELVRSLPQEDVPILADPDLVGHMLLNLLGNAIEAAGPQGQVEIRLETDDETALLEVWDSGPGPSPEIASRLFEPFVTGKPGGIGLGLAVAQQVTASHGGTLAWDRQGNRTRFTVRLPLEGKPPADENQPR